MAWEDELEPDWIYELPFYLVATIAYGAILTVNPTLRWGTGKAPDGFVSPSLLRNCFQWRGANSSRESGRST